MDPAERFTALYDECHPKVFAYAVTVAGRGLAEEVAGETFCIAWRRFSDLPDPPLPWLPGVARNVARKNFRDGVRQESLARELSGWPDRPRTRPPPWSPRPPDVRPTRENPDARRLIQALAAARPDSAPDQARRERDLTRTLASPAAARPARRRGRSHRPFPDLGVISAGTAVAVVVMTGTTTPPQSSPPETEAAPAPMSARDILLTAGASSLKAPESRGDFLYTRRVSGRQLSIPGKDHLLDRRMEQEMWRAKESGHHQYMINRELGTTLASPAAEEAWKADGSPRSWTFDIPRFQSRYGGVGRIGSRLATQENLAKLPTGPKALYDRLHREQTAMADAAPKESQARPEERRYLFPAEIFRWGIDLIARLPVSPALRSAAFGMLSYIPGVEARGEMTDPWGRKGQAVALSGQADLRSARTGETIKEGTLYDIVLLIDPSTGTALAIADQISKPVSPPSDRQGQWRSYELFKESRWIPALPMARLKHAKHSR